MRANEWIIWQSAREREPFRPQEGGVSGEQRDIVHEAGGRDQLVGRIAANVEARAGIGDFPGDRPHVHTSEDANDRAATPITLLQHWHPEARK